MNNENVSGAPEEDAAHEPGEMLSSIPNKPIEDEEEGEEETTDSSESEQSEPWREGPWTPVRLRSSTSNICRELEEIIFSAKERFNGSYYFTAQYDILDAPNPILRLTAGNIGTVDLPLSEAAAKQIITHSKQAPFGMGERTLVDKDVRDTWEMDSGFVQFDNPEWNSFVAKLVEEVCAGLGVNFYASRPRAELYKLLLYETGSHFLPHQDTEKVDGMFATMIVILPSAYTGGAAHLSHADLSTTIDSSAGSLSSTSVMAWYTDVTHEIKPVTSGYRLALSYNLIHTTSALRPSLPNVQGPLLQLRNALLTWKQAGYRGPPKIVYLLDHKYSLANLRGSALKGTDAHLASLLDVLARELDFCLGLATVECHASGYGRGDEYDDDEYEYEYEYEYDDDEDDDNEDDDSEDDDSEDDDSEDDDNEHYVFRRPVEFDCRTMKTTATNLINMEGCLISDKLDFSVGAYGDGDHTIPSYFKSKIQQGDHYRQEYEGYQGNTAGTFERWYRRTILVIWPSRRNAEIMCGRSFREKALRALRETASAKASKEEREYVEYILEHLWNDLALWRRAICICYAYGFDDYEKLGSDNIVKAVLKFGSDEILPSIERILENGSTNAKRLTLLEEIEAKMTSLGGPMLGSWVSKEREIVLRSLRPFVNGEERVLIETVSKLGGIIALEQYLIAPQVKSNSHPRDLLALTLALHAEQVKEDGAFKDPADTEACDRIKTELLSHAIEHENFFGVLKRREFNPPLSHYSYPSLKAEPFTNSAAYIQACLRGFSLGPPNHMPSPSLSQLYIGGCLETGNESLVEKVVDRLVNVSGTATDPSTIDGRPLVLLTLVPYFNKMVKERSATLPPRAIDLFYTSTIPLLLAHMERGSLFEAEAVCIIQAVAIAGGIELLEKTILPNIAATPWTTDIYELFIRQLRACEPQFAPKPGTTSSISTIVASLTQTMASEATLRTPASTINMLNFCYEMDSGSCYIDILSRILHENIAASHEIEFFLLPLIPDLVHFASCRHISISAPPLVSYFKAVMSAWAERILGPKPTLNATVLLACAQKITCRCHLCAGVAAFLCSSPGKTHALYGIGAPAAKHLEYKLERAGASVIATWETLLTIPRGLQVVKTNEAYQSSRWATTQLEGITALKHISTDENLLAEIFGDDGYKELLRALDVRWVNAPLDMKPDSPQVYLTPQPSTLASETTAIHPTLADEDSNPPKRRKIHLADDTEIADLA
ncbi:hypothetical protein BOTBODRAFT_187419 [Botryobasidium botryosum FD-172 SS1]|uniref:Fe2OG dioxygenase domain-containing protein n=1 Tax=Botryobasidium botryosum (strain FD-172 SS1) TaxID=930990 RepID=A0A067MU19_BOTB1|nr:hypothetical protein BOTBODRAFT_187419 [Botryobasidium botryosum FD-172 SS1]